MKRTLTISKSTMTVATLLLISALLMPLNPIFAQIEQCSGTGFALSAEGYIATAAHVIQDATSIKIIGVEGNHSISYNAKVVACDDVNDVAIIKIEDAEFATLGNVPYVIKENGVQLLHSCFVMGYPETELLDTTLKATSGQVNGIYPLKILYNAPSQHGNSGSPLFCSEDGTVIGVVVSRISSSGWGMNDVIQNANFATKISCIKFLADSLGIKLPTVNQMQGDPSNMVAQATPFVYRIITTVVSSVPLLLANYPALDIQKLEILNIDPLTPLQLPFFGQPKIATWRDYNILSKGKLELRHKIVQSYNKNGDILSEKEYDEYEDLVYQKDCLYENNQLSEIYIIKIGFDLDLWSEEETLVGKIKLNRNSKKQIVAATSYYFINKDTICLQRARFTYENEKINKIYLSESTDQFAEERNLVTYIYNEYGQTVASVSDFGDTIHYEYLNPYTDIVSKLTAFSGSINYTIKKFHKSGKPLKTLLQNETTKNRIEYKYKYDKQNNFISIRNKNSYTTLDIEYY
jgi:hypothetical protein